MSIARKLARKGEKKARIERLRAAMKGVEARPRQQTAIARDRARTSMLGAQNHHGQLPGRVIETQHGPLHRVDVYLEPHHHHGAAPVARATKVRGSLAAEFALDPTFEALDLSNALFLDTETTGLAGGTGTVAFLIGMAWFEDESLRVQQLFLPEFGGEEPMLHALSERLRKSSCLVSYNGKSFDWPLLRNRFVINRVKMPRFPPHLDLLHCVRRIFKPRLATTRLVDLEREVLGMFRHDDVPGALIPSLYFDYVDGGDPASLLGVFEHNANDLIALAALLAKIAVQFGEVCEADDPRDHLAYAKVAERAGNLERARAFAQAAIGGGASADSAVDAWMLQARVARRNGEIEVETQALVQAFRSSGDPALTAAARLALAKLYEHRLKDLEQALEHAPHTCPAEPAHASDRRVRRLERRLARLG